MAKYKCKCGNEDFIAVTDDTFFLELEVDEDKLLTVKVVDQDVLGDAEALTIVCSECKRRARPKYEDVEWNWDGVR